MPQQALAGGFGNRQRGTHAHLAFSCFSHVLLCATRVVMTALSPAEAVTSSLIAYPKAGELSFLCINKWHQRRTLCLHWLAQVNQRKPLRALGNLTEGWRSPPSRAALYLFTFCSCSLPYSFSGLKTLQGSRSTFFQLWVCTLSDVGGVAVVLGRGVASLTSRLTFLDGCCSPFLRRQEAFHKPLHLFLQCIPCCGDCTSVSPFWSIIGNCHVEFASVCEVFEGPENWGCLASSELVLWLLREIEHFPSGKQPYRSYHHLRISLVTKSPENVSYFHISES